MVDAQAFGSGQEQHTLELVLTEIEERYNRLNISENIYAEEAIVTADTGFANEGNMKYLHEHNINAYIPDNQFRSRDPKFSEQKTKYGKQHQNDKNKPKKRFKSTEFIFDPVDKTCTCPAGHAVKFRSERENELGHQKVNFVGYRKPCKACDLIQRCMKIPASAEHYDGCGRQASFIIKKAKRKANYTDWMKRRVDSPEGKLIYNHRMLVISA